MVMLVYVCLFFLFALYAHAAMALRVGCRHWCWWLLELLPLPERLRCSWFLLERAPTVLDRCVAVLWTLYGVENRILQVPVVGSLLFEPLGLQCCATLDTSPQVCHEAGRICGGHDVAILDQCVDVDLPFAEELHVGFVLSVCVDRLCRLLQSLLSPDCGGCRLGPPCPFGRRAGFRIGLASFERACRRDLCC